MATAFARSHVVVQPLSPFAGLLSYLVPGLGQIVQGRIGKGLLFLVCIYTLFFYGIYLGTGSVTIDSRTYRLTSNVYLPDTSDENAKEPIARLATNLYNRPQFAGQFWVGVAAWPAIWQYMHYDRFTNQKLDREIDELYSAAKKASERKEPEDAALKQKEAEELERGERGATPFSVISSASPAPALSMPSTTPATNDWSLDGCTRSSPAFSTSWSSTTPSRGRPSQARGTVRTPRSRNQEASEDA